jgi:hypothetical protein
MSSILEQAADDLVTETAHHVPPTSLFVERAARHRRRRALWAGAATAVLLGAAGGLVFIRTSPQQQHVTTSHQGNRTAPSRPANATTPSGQVQSPSPTIPFTPDPNCNSTMPGDRADGVTASLHLDKAAIPSTTDRLYGQVVVHNGSSKALQIEGGGPGIEAFVLSPDGQRRITQNIGISPSNEIPYRVAPGTSSPPIGSTVGLAPCLPARPGERLPAGEYQVRGIVPLDNGARVATNSVTITILDPSP